MDAPERIEFDRMHIENGLAVYRFDRHIEVVSDEMPPKKIVYVHADLYEKQYHLVEDQATRIATLEQRAEAAEHNFGVEHDEVERLRTALADAFSAGTRAVPDVPTPERLEAWAEWFDNPNEVGAVVVESFSREKKYTAGYVLRRVADSFRAETGGE
jgi:hypothetical protein